MDFWPLHHSDEPYMLDEPRVEKEKLAKLEDLSRAQQTTINSLKDELAAVKLMAAETQLKQLNELETLTKENKELKETLVALIRQQHPPTADEHKHGNLEIDFIIYY